LRQKPNSPLLETREITGVIAVTESGLDDVFIDDITFPAADGYLLGATLFFAARGQARPDQFGHRGAAQDSIGGSPAISHGAAT
jgi:hypothetical protein